MSMRRPKMPAPPPPPPSLATAPGGSAGSTPGAASASMFRFSAAPALAGFAPRKQGRRSLIGG